jgi:hypothetical protein
MLVVEPPIQSRNLLQLLAWWYVTPWSRLFRGEETRKVSREALAVNNYQGVYFHGFFILFILMFFYFDPHFISLPCAPNPSQSFILFPIRLHPTTFPTICICKVRKLLASFNTKL